jgi:hypothetical protein
MQIDSIDMPHLQLSVSDYFQTLVGVYQSNWIDQYNVDKSKAEIVAYYSCRVDTRSFPVHVLI